MLGKDSNEALKKLLEKNLLGLHAKDLKQLCSCGKGYIEGFCSVCNEVVCSHCGFQEMQHNLWSATCINCQIGNHEEICSKCGQPVCLRCGKKKWFHEHQFCKAENQQLKIGILEVDHDCWFSNISEKTDQSIMLNNFSDRKDIQTGTHSGILKIELDNKRKTIGKILKQDIIKEAKLIHKHNKNYFLKTRALIDKSVDEFSKANHSILLNPVIAIDSKEQNLIISPSNKEMRKLSKGLQEFGGKVRLITTEDFDIHNIKGIKNKQISKFLQKVPKKELLDNIQKIAFCE